MIQPIASHGLRRHILIAALSTWASASSAQVVEYKAGPVTAYPSPDANNEFLKKVRWGRDPSAALALYVAVFRGTPGALDSVVVDTASQALAVQFPTLNFVVSAASRIQSEIGEAQLGGNLRRINAHVLLTPLDSLRRPIPDGSAIEVLAIRPNSIEVELPDSTKAVRKATFLSVVSRAYLPGALALAGARATAVAANFHNSGLVLTSPTQVSYMSAGTEFGWTWYEHPQHSIEGIHRTEALLQASTDVRYVRVHVELITDWKYHGTWMKPFDTVIDVGQARAAKRP